MKSEIQLNSRGGIDNRLVQVEGEPLKFELKTDYNYRVGIIDKNSEEYSFIDPSGGPFMQKGTVIDGNVIKSISRGEEGRVIIDFEL